MIDSTTVEPPLASWSGHIAYHARAVSGHERLRAWQVRSREELGLPTDRPVLATGHQTLLWHPGILAKYLAVEAARGGTDAAVANLIVDQHADGFGVFEAPGLRSDGSLVAQTFRLTTERPGVPMGLHEPFHPAAPPSRWRPALPSVARGVEAILEAVAAHDDAPNAARQMAGALGDLMSPWVGPMIHVTSSELVETTLARVLLEAMAEDPHACAEHYNRAVAAFPEAGIAPLVIRDDYVEVPLWRIRDTGERMRAWDNDVQRCFEDPASAPTLMPRALFLTALVRLAMCDLFVHGLGGANYDRAMERWITHWLELPLAPIATVSATVRLPLARPEPKSIELEKAIAAYRQRWHDPDAKGSKRAWLARIDAAPRGSTQRRDLFLAMHEALAASRREHQAALETLQHAIATAREAIREAPIIDRRTWPFPLYEKAEIAALARELVLAERT